MILALLWFEETTDKGRRSFLSEPQQSRSLNTPFRTRRQQKSDNCQSDSKALQHDEPSCPVGIIEGSEWHGKLKTAGTPVNRHTLLESSNQSRATNELCQRSS